VDTTTASATLTVTPAIALSNVSPFSGLATPTGIAVDSSNNKIVVGNFTGTQTFGSKTLSSQGGKDGFLLSLDNAGSVNFALSFGGQTIPLPGDEGNAAHDVAVDSSGNIYVVGSIYGTTAYIESSDGNDASISNPSGGKQDIFIAKWNSSGVLQWHKVLGDTEVDVAYDIAVSDLGYVFVAGKFGGEIQFGAQTVQSNGYAAFALKTSDLFVSKLDLNGNFQWTSTLGTINEGDSAYALDVDANGNVYVFGTIWFMPGLTGEVDSAIFAFDGSGAEIWSKI